MDLRFCLNEKKKGMKEYFKQVYFLSPVYHEEMKRKLFPFAESAGQVVWIQWSVQWMKFDINQVEIFDLSILEVDNNFKSFPTCPQFCMIVCVICKWSPPPSLLSLVLSIMIMGFRDREVIAVNPVLSKQKHKCHSATIADTPNASHLKLSWIPRISSLWNECSDRF